MQIETLNSLWSAYKARPVNMTFHPDDHMHNYNNRDVSLYNIVGESGTKILFSALSLSPTETVSRVLDFGCGHGRVARQMRAMFPDAEMTFVDIDQGASTFCAEQFKGTTATSTEDFADLDLPEDMDLIWVGSVFTHINARQMQHLFTALARSLRRGGTLVATFLGRYAIEYQKSKPMIEPQKWAEIMNQYGQTGVGHQPYSGAIGHNNWGISLISAQRALALADGDRQIRPLGYLEQAWANFHDVGIWTKR